MKKILLATVICITSIGAILFARFQAQHVFSFPTEISATLPDATGPVIAEFDPLQEDWAQWRGTNRDGIAGSTDLLERWPAKGPRLLWTASGLGTGMSSVSIANASIFTLGVQNGQVRVVCRSAKDGAEKWVAEIGDGGDPNGTPTVDGDRVYAITREGRIVCAETETGRIVWTRDFVNEFDGAIPTWGYSESPLIDDGRIICTPGSDDAMMVALDRLTGETIWKTSVPTQMQRKGHRGAGYSSPIFSRGGGVHQYVQAFGGGVISVAAADGSVLWGYSRVANPTAVIPTPIVYGDYVFASSGYNTGAALLKLVRTAAGINPEEVYFHRGNKVQNHHGGMVLIDGHVYMGHGHNKGLGLCLDLLSGVVKWGPVRGPGSGSAAIAYADGHLYFRYENARMALIEATPSGYVLKSEFRIPSHLGKSWPHPAIARKRLYLRDQNVLLCYDLAKNPVLEPRTPLSENSSGEAASSQVAGRTGLVPSEVNNP